MKVSEDLIIEADPKRVRQCVENVVANAVKYSPHEAPVTVLMRRTRHDERDMALVEIIDEGPGIASEMLPHIFKRFVTSERRQGGLGLGLYLAKRIAELHGGALSVESKIGAGAQFALMLPCFREQA